MVLASGCFDGLHSGHVAYLTAAAALCRPDEPLVVAVESDAEIRRAKQREPRWSGAQRRRTLSALRGVDDVRPAGALHAIQTWQPRLFVKGVDWAGKLSEEIRQACAACGCAIVYVDTDETHTSERL